ncbi:hypothetical protein RRG08_033468 [Elysia crispata]|uniref:Uncharacterized protein n=1 Tax=Elysia crispata TaxID=231223 RepID=A0AAE1E4N5_9GAST|nr:hypothetical protein RRG08_033468 [Elysia crispata]
MHACMLALEVEVCRASQARVRRRWLALVVSTCYSGLANHPDFLRGATLYRPDSRISHLRRDFPVCPPVETRVSAVLAGEEIRPHLLELPPHTEETSLFVLLWRLECLAH